MNDEPLKPCGHGKDYACCCFNPDPDEETKDVEPDVVDQMKRRAKWKGADADT